LRLALPHDDSRREMLFDHNWLLFQQGLMKQAQLLLVRMVSLITTKIKKPANCRLFYLSKERTQII